MAESGSDSGSISPSEIALTWTDSQEKLLIEWADNALCYEWLHTHSMHYNRKWHQGLTLPVILISTVTGTANFGMPGLSIENQRVLQIIIGSLSLGAALFTTLSEFFKVAQIMEAHRRSALSWGKLHRTISIELSQRRDQRMHCVDFVKHCRADLDRLIEQSPSIPSCILSKFQKEFRNAVDVHMPHICNGLEPTQVCNDPVPRKKNVMSPVQSPRSSDIVLKVLDNAAKVAV